MSTVLLFAQAAQGNHLAGTAMIGDKPKRRRWT
jgi:hypothetical protein